MNISDLELVENLSETTDLEGGSYYYPGHQQYDYVNGYISYGSFTVGVAYGHVAIGSADANAYGYGTFTKGATATLTTPYSSGSSAYSASVTSW